MTYNEVKKAWMQASWRNHVNSMVGSQYVVERRGREFCLSHFVADDKVSEDWGGGRILRSDFEGEY